MNSRHILFALSMVIFLLLVMLDRQWTRSTLQIENNNIEGFIMPRKQADIVLMKPTFAQQTILNPYIHDLRNHVHQHGPTVMIIHAREKVFY